MVLLLITADGVDLDHPGHLSQLRPDDPVLHFTQGGGIPGLAVFPCCTGNRVHRIHEDFAQSGGDRPHFRLHSGRQNAFNGTEAFIDQVAGEVDIRTFLEHHGNLRQAITGQ